MLRAIAIGYLRQGEATVLLDGLDAKRAVGVASGEHDAGGGFPTFGGEGAEEDVDRLALAATDIRPLDLEDPAGDPEHRVRRQHVDGVHLHARTVRGDIDRHPGQLGDDLM
jgi:hypothetical protein